MSAKDAEGKNYNPKGKNIRFVFLQTPTKADKLDQILARARRIDNRDKREVSAEFICVKGSDGLLIRRLTKLLEGAKTAASSTMLNGLSSELVTKFDSLLQEYKQEVLMQQQLEFHRRGLKDYLKSLIKETQPDCKNTQDFLVSLENRRCRIDSFVIFLGHLQVSDPKEYETIRRLIKESKGEDQNADDDDKKFDYGSINYLTKKIKCDPKKGNDMVLLLKMSSILPKDYPKTLNEQGVIIDLSSINKDKIKILKNLIDTGYYRLFKGMGLDNSSINTGLLRASKIYLGQQKRKRQDSPRRSL